MIFPATVIQKQPLRLVQIYVPIADLTSNHSVATDYL